MNLRKFFASFLAVVLGGAGAWPRSAAAAAGRAAAPVSIGVAGAVKGLVRAVPELAPESVGRIVKSGKPLYLNEHVTTGPGGHLQIMLKDETLFTIGPDSDIVLDEFIYDPKTSSGKVSASISKGVFRFITGNVGKKDPSSMEVKLPAGTIGIRGTIVAGKVIPGGPSTAILLGPGAANSAGERAGAFNLNNVHGSVSVDTPGFGSSLPGGGLPPTPPTLIPGEQMRAILGDLAPKTMADRAEEGKQMMAERLAQKLSGEKQDKEGDDGKGPGGPPMSEGERKLAEKMMSGEKLDPEEQAQARMYMKQGHMSEAEMKLAEKMMTGGDFTPEEHHQMSMMIAGEQMLEHMGPGNMTPEQMKLAESMMAGTMTPEQQMAMMKIMTPEQQSMMGDMMMPPPGMMPGEGGYMPPPPGGYPNGTMPPPPPGGYTYDPNMPPGTYDPNMPPGTYDPNMMGTYDPNMMGTYDPNMMGTYDPNKMGTYDPNFSPYGDIGMYDGTQQFFGTYDPNYSGNYYVPPPGSETTGIPDGPTSWDAIRTNIVSGTGYFPGQSGNFYLSTCNGGSCTSPSGTWGFSNIVMNFGAKTVSGTANMTGVTATGLGFTVNDSRTFNIDFSSLSGGAMIGMSGAPTGSGGGNVSYNFGIGNSGGIAAHVLHGDASYNKAGPTNGSGTHLVSYSVPGSP